MLTEDWRKSTRSAGGSDCAEVRIKGNTIEMRDSKQGDAGPVLSFTRAEWEAFLGGTRLGEFDL